MYERDRFAMFTQEVDSIEELLPQTQCGQCGFPTCRSYAEALAAGKTDINRCPPGGTEGIHQLAHYFGTVFKPLAIQHGIETLPTMAVIEEMRCIGCTLCLKACPVDAIIGATGCGHTVIARECTGCKLCLPCCPVECIQMVDHSEWLLTGTKQERAKRAKKRFYAKKTREDQEQQKQERNVREKKNRLVHTPTAEIRMAVERARRNRVI